MALRAGSIAGRRSEAVGSCTGEYRSMRVAKRLLIRLFIRLFTRLLFTSMPSGCAMRAP